MERVCVWEFSVSRRSPRTSDGYSVSSCYAITWLRVVGRSATSMWPCSQGSCIFARRCHWHMVGSSLQSALKEAALDCSPHLTFISYPASALWLISALFFCLCVCRLHLHTRRGMDGRGAVYEQRRVDLATFRAVPASTWGHCPQALLFTIVWDTPGKEKLPNCLPPPPAF